MEDDVEKRLIMPDVFREVASQYPSRVAGSYLYSILPIVGQKLAALTSADELLLIDKSRLELVSQYHDDVPAPVACMTGCDSAEESIIAQAAMAPWPSLT